MKTKHYSFVIALFLSLMGTLPMVAKSIVIPNFGVGDFSFKLWDDGTAELTHAKKDITQAIIPASINYGNESYYTVTKIGRKAFSERTDLTSVEIPDGITYIDDYAFEKCTNLASVKIPNSVLQIGNYAFDDCSNMTSLEISSSVNCIASYTFHGCKSLKSVKIPNSVKCIYQYAFSGCSGLQTVEIPNSVNTIEKCAFLNCRSLESVEIPNSITDINAAVFKGCRGLTSVIIPNSVTHIRCEAFAYCSSLISVEIPNSVMSVEDGVFKGCSSLESVVIPDSDISVSSYVFCGCSSLTSINLPSSLTVIGYNMFENCSSLTSIAIPASVTDILNSAFSGCNSMTSICLPESLKRIDDSAFNGCEALESIIIPKNVSYVGIDAFAGCKNLSTVTSRRTMPPSIIVPTHNPHPKAFDDNTYWRATLFVPSENIQAYSAAENWMHFKNIQAIPTPVESIEISPSSIYAKVGERVNVVVKIFPETATDKSLTWTSSDENIATVDADGKVTITGIGSAEITATANDGSGVTASASVNGIATAAESVSISAEGSTTLQDGQTVKLIATVLPENTTDKTVTWQSSDEDIASVDSNGLVIAHEKTGTATITASCGHVSSSIDITVAPTPVESIVVMPSDLNIEVGEQAQLEVTVLPENATDKSLTWVSSDPEVAAVSAEGVVSGKGSGTATISAVCASNSSIFGTCSVNIALPSGIASTESNSIRLRVSNQELIIEGSDAMVQVITADGRCVYSGFERKIKLQRGIYIVIIGKSVTKIVV